jgi:hypothetical protein
MDPTGSHVGKSRQEKTRRDGFTSCNTIAFTEDTHAFKGTADLHGLLVELVSMESAFYPLSNCRRGFRHRRSRKYSRWPHHLLP